MARLFVPEGQDDCGRVLYGSDLLLVDLGLGDRHVPTVVFVTGVDVEDRSQTEAVGCVCSHLCVEPLVALFRLVHPPVLSLTLGLHQGFHRVAGLVHIDGAVNIDVWHSERIALELIKPDVQLIEEAPLHKEALIVHDGLDDPVVATCHVRVRHCFARDLGGGSLGQHLVSLSHSGEGRQHISGQRHAAHSVGEAISHVPEVTRSHEAGNTEEGAGELLEIPGGLEGRDSLPFLITTHREQSGELLERGTLHEEHLPVTPVVLQLPDVPQGDDTLVFQLLLPLPLVFSSKEALSHHAKEQESCLGNTAPDHHG